MYRLETVSKDLPYRISKSSDEEKRKIIIKSCEYAIKKSNMDNELFNNIIYEFKKGTLSESHKMLLEELCEKYDYEYLNLQETGIKDNNNKASWIVPFRYARAIASILNCFNKDLERGAIESVYEAYMTNNGETDGLIFMIKEILQGS